MNISVLGFFLEASIQLRRLTSNRFYSGSNLALEQYSSLSKMQGASLIQGKTTGNQPCEKFPQENYNGEITPYQLCCLKKKSYYFLFARLFPLHYFLVKLSLAIISGWQPPFFNCGRYIVYYNVIFSSLYLNNLLFLNLKS